MALVSGGDPPLHVVSRTLQCKQQGKNDFSSAAGSIADSENNLRWPLKPNYALTLSPSSIAELSERVCRSFIADNNLCKYLCLGEGELQAQRRRRAGAASTETEQSGN